jgi:TPR repeat protein
MSAQYQLGLLHCCGTSVSQDYALAAYWLRKAADNLEPTPHFDNEVTWPQSELAHLYREGKGVERDMAQAVHWYKKSLEHINCCSEFALAMAYECGHGVKQDSDKAIKLYKSHRNNRDGANETAEFFFELLHTDE